MHRFLAALVLAASALSPLPAIAQAQTNVTLYGIADAAVEYQRTDVGGVKTMGFLGLFIGPVLMALLVAIWREWLMELRSEEKASVLAPPHEPPTAA